MRRASEENVARNEAALERARLRAIGERLKEVTGIAVRDIVSLFLFEMAEGIVQIGRSQGSQTHDP